MLVNTAPDLKRRWISSETCVQSNVHVEEYINQGKCLKTMWNASQTLFRAGIH